jgi:hypothetical protein
MLLLTRQTYVVVRCALIPSLRLIDLSSSSKPLLSSHDTPSPILLSHFTKPSSHPAASIPHTATAHTINKHPPISLRPFDRESSKEVPVI